MGLFFLEVAVIVALADAYLPLSPRSFAPASKAGVVPQRQIPALSFLKCIRPSSFQGIRSFRAPAASISRATTDASRAEIKTALGFNEEDREPLAEIIWPAYHSK